MKPAFSVIFFTVMSGSGYGLLFLLGLGLALQPHMLNARPALVALAVGLSCCIAGLLSSTLHLGKPQRAWRAFSQWRSSWLSREGVVSVCSFAPALLLGLALWADAPGVVLGTLAVALAIFAIATVFCTARIYSSLKTIHAWHSAYVLPGYMLMGLFGGSTLLLAILALFGALGTQSGLAWTLYGLSIATSLCAIAIKRAYWRFIDTTNHPATTESATGLGRFGNVRAQAAPHTEQNYLTNEMGFVLARKHARQLRSIATVLIGPVSIAGCIGIGLLAPAFAVFSSAFALLTVGAALTGLFVERWLFFAEAKHVVMLYYGAAQPVTA